MTSTQPPRIEIRNLNKTFHRVGGSSIKPVDDVSLTVADQELVVLLGPSGCGKTTLLRCVAGLEKPDSGEIRINGHLVYSSDKGIFLPPEQRDLSMIFQSFTLWPHMSVADNVAYPLESRGVPRGEIGARVQAALDLVGIGNLGRQFPATISGGQQQRVALARALVSNSTVVLFDEPLSSVDAKVREQLRAEINKMQRQIGFSGLYVTHDQTEAMELGHRIAVLESGRIAALGAPREVYANPPSEYVATFVGAANIWRGRVRETDQSGTLVEIGSDELRVATQPGSPARRTGDAISVMARPEDLRLLREEPANDRNGFEVTVESAAFAGPHIRYLVQRNDLQALVWQRDLEAGTELAPGTRAWLAVDTRRARLVEGSRDTVQ